MVTRDDYPNLDPEVSVHNCTAENPMPPEVGDRAQELKQLWVHHDTEEIWESDSGRFMRVRCLHCKYEYTIDFGDD